MKILIATSEAHPYSKSGGLADMVGALAKFVAQTGSPVDLVTPLYKGIPDHFGPLTPVERELKIPMANDIVSGRLKKLSAGENLTVYFVDQPGYYHRRHLYQEDGADYPDNAERFIFFSKCAALLAHHLPEPPDVVHAHDWQTGLIPLFIRHEKSRGAWPTAPPSVFTLHNLAYQGVFGPQQFELTNLPGDYFQPEGLEFYGQLNCLKAGIVYADALTTVSPRYAREITTEAFGCGLDGVLRQRQTVLTGMLNGVDYDEWQTTGNPHLRYSYSIRNLSGKTREKLALQTELGLPAAAGIPLFGAVTRLVTQKGVDLTLGALEEMLAADMQFVLLGSGAPLYEDAFRELARRHPGKVAVRIGFDQPLSHRLEAGCDFYLMPSRFEPCGLNQMYSLRFGTIPVVRATGGLDDSVIDPSEDPEQANGIKFHENSIRALARAIRKALVLYQNPRLLRHFRKNAMAADFSWERTAKEYQQVYQRLQQG